MMTNRLTSLLFFLPLCILLFTQCGAQKETTQTDKPTSPTIDMTKKTTDPYADLWKKVDSLDREGLPKSALEIVDTIYQQAKSDSYADEQIKSLIYKIKFESTIQEYGSEKSIARFEKEIDEVEQPMKSILQSMLAEMYTNYLSRNQYKFRDRSETQDFKSDDIATWSAGQLSERAMNLYWTSIDYDGLKSVAINQFDAITSQAVNTENLRPTLYDFLVHRAIDHFMNERSYLTQPAYAFKLSDEQLFGSPAKYAKLKIETADTISSKYNTLLLFQDLLSFRIQQQNIPALISADLKRLKFVHNQHVASNKDALYESALSTMIIKFGQDTAVSEAKAYLAQLYYQQAPKYQIGNPDETYKWRYKEALEICNDVITKYPNSIGASMCITTKNSILETPFSFQVEKVNEVNKPFRLSMSYKNIEKAYFRVIKTSDEDLKSLNNMDYDKKSEYLNQVKPIKSWNVKLPLPGDYRTHRTEIKVDPLPSGRYMILASMENDFLPDSTNQYYLTTDVSNLAYFSRTLEDNHQEFTIVDRTSGEPIIGATVDFYSQDWDRKSRTYNKKKRGSAKTDKNGMATSQGVNLKERNFLISIRHNDDVLDTDQSFYYYSGRNKPIKNTRAQLFTDRKIYRPGQTVYFKSIIYEGYPREIPELVTGRSFGFSLYDANGQQVESLEGRTNEYGTFSGSFVLPQGGLLGQMRIDVAGTGSTYFRVEEYKRPKFEVAFDPVKKAYKLNDKVTVSGFAKAYAGSNIDGAKVNYRVVRQTSYPYYPWRWYGYSYRPPTPSMEIINGTTTTDSDGKFTIDFDAIPDESIDPKTKPVFNYQVYADVVDITGETHSSNTSVSVGYVSLMLSATVKSIMLVDSFNAITINSKNLNGQFEKATGELKIERLQSPERYLRKRFWQVPDQFVMDSLTFKKHFPADEYKSESQVQSWPVEAVVYNQAFDTQKAPKVDLSNQNFDVGVYRYTLTSKDKDGIDVEYSSIVSLYNIEKKQVPMNIDFLVDSPQSTVEPGSEASLIAGTALAPVKVLFEIEYKGTITSRSWVYINQLQVIKQAIKEKHRGNLGYHLTFVKDNRIYQKSSVFRVPYTNRQLTFSYETFRDKLQPGQEEEWRVRVSGPNKDQVAAEVVATMYDASLDKLYTPNYWSLNVLPTFYNQRRVSTNTFTTVGGQVYASYYSYISNDFSYQFRQLLWFGYNPANGMRLRRSKSRASYSVDGIRVESAEAPMMLDDMVEEEAVMSKKEVRDLPTKDVGAIASTAAGVSSENKEPAEASPDDPAKSDPEKPIQVRENLNETVFFFPELSTDEKGDVLIKFKMSEALTRWNFLLFAHTKDLKFGSSTNNTVTQKELMVFPNPPRFFRESDQITFTAKVSNLTKETLSGNAKLELFNALTMEPVDQLLGNTKPDLSFQAGGGQSDGLSWDLSIPVGTTFPITHKVTARAGAFSDGEMSTLPTLINRMLVTETMPLPIKGKETKTFVFDRMNTAGQSSTLKHHNYALEFTSNPAWYAVKSLPYLIEYPYECSEQLFNRYYANSLASSVANAHPKIKRVFDQWKNDPDALESQLTKNEELKSALIAETPWVMAAQSEAAQRKNIGLLFDLNRMSYEMSTALNKLDQRQGPDGGFSWFPGGRSNWYITQYIVEGLGHLDRLGVDVAKQDAKAKKISNRAIRYIDDRIAQQYKDLKDRVAASNGKIKLEDNHLNYTAVHYLYARSFFKDQKMNDKTSEAHDYYLGQSEKYWLSQNLYAQAMIGLALDRYERKEIPGKIVKSLRERSLNDEEQGMYWKYNTGYYWYQLPIETHTMMIELFDEVAKDEASVDQLKVWLLKNKQTTHWKTTKATAAAVYAFLSRGDNWLLEDEQVTIELGKTPGRYAAKIKEAQSGAEAGTGYFKTSWSEEQVTSDMSTIKVTNPNNVIAWGAAYWQYFEQLDKITTFEETPLQIKKELFKEVPSDRGPQLKLLDAKTRLIPGDKVKVRIEVRVDRDMEYVHLKDMRASGFEPINVLSQYKWQGGLGYYESTRDAATDFFMSYLPKGTYVFEYPLRVVHEGDFSNGITTMQSMYAPEFSSHSAGVRVKISGE